MDSTVWLTFVLTKVTLVTELMSWRCVIASKIDRFRVLNRKAVSDIAIPTFCCRRGAWEDGGVRGRKPENRLVGIADATLVVLPSF